MEQGLRDGIRRRILFLARTEVESQKSVLIINTDGIHEWAEIEDECVQVESC